MPRGTKRTVLLLTLWFAVLAVPASVTRFDGLPFSSLPEAFALAVLVPVVFSAAHRRLFRRMVARRSRGIRLALLATLVCAGALKATLATVRPPGFQACYETPLTPPPVGKCER